MRRNAGDPENNTLGPANGYRESNGRRNGHGPGGAPSPWSRRGLRSLALPVLVALACGAGAFVIARAMPNVYRSDATLYFPSQGNQSAASIIGSLSGNGSLAAPTDAAGNVPLLGGIVTSPQVASGPNTAMFVMSSLRCRTQVARECRLEERWRLPLREVLKRLDVSVAYGVDKNGLLAIECTDPDPLLARQITQAYITALKDVATEMSVAPSRKNREFLENRMRILRANLQSKQNQLVAMQTHSDQTAPLSAASDKVAGALLDLQGQKTQAQVELAATDARIRRQTQVAQSTLQNSLNLPADVPYAQQARDRLRRLEADLATAETTDGPDNPEYRLLQLQVRAARAQVRAEVSREMGALEKGIAPEVATLYALRSSQQARLAGLEQAIAQMKEDLSAVPSTQMRQARLTNEIRNEQGVLDMLATETERARIVESRNAATFEVVDPPLLPVEPFAPRRAYITAFAALAGLLLGVAWLVGRAVVLQIPLWRENLRPESPERAVPPAEDELQRTA